MQMPSTTGRWLENQYEQLIYYANIRFSCEDLVNYVITMIMTNFENFL